MLQRQKPRQDAGARPKTELNTTLPWNYGHARHTLCKQEIGKDDQNGDGDDDGDDNGDYDRGVSKDSGEPA